MALLKLLTAAACVAAACGQKLSNDDGNIMMRVADGKKVSFQSGTEPATNLNDLVTNVAAATASSYLHLGYQNGYENKVQEIDALIKVEQEKLDTAESAHAVLAAKVAAAKLAYDAGAGKEIADLQAKLLTAQKGGGGANKLAGVGVCSSGAGSKTCDAAGGETVAAAVIGEVYANTEGVFTCTYTWGKEKMSTDGMGHAASATGKLSAVTCDTPTFSVAYLAKVAQSKDKNKWVTVLSIEQAGVGIPFGGTTGGNEVAFITAPPAAVDVSALAAIEVYNIFVRGGKTVDSGVFSVKDADSPASALKFSFAGLDTNYLTVSVAVVDSKDGEHHFKLQFKGSGKTGAKLMNTKMTVMDQNGNKAEVPVSIQYTTMPNLQIKLATTRGGKVRNWHDTAFWEAKSGEVNAQAASNYKSFGNDIKTKGYYAPIGARMDIEFYQGSTKKGVASYDIAKDFQSVSLRDLVTDAKYNTKVIGKKAKSRSSGKFWGSVLTARDGNCRANKGDPFIDQDYDLRVRMRNEFNSQDSWDRIGFVYKDGCKGGHQFGGIGGTHKHGSWRVSYEVMPISGYCSTQNGYGYENHGYNQPGGGHHPFKHCTDRNAKKVVDIAITRGV